MTHHSHHRPEPALSFGGVADAYERSRPSYPAAAAAWLTATGRMRVLELGAGTGKLTEQLVALGHDVVATDPSREMLQHLAARVPTAHVAQSAAERIPLASRTFDVVTAGQAFHWFDVAKALPEIARVLRPGGRLSLAWNHRDERIPWVRRLGALIGTPPQEDDPTDVIVGSRLFGFVDSSTFRFWHPVNRKRLRDLVSSRSHVAVMTPTERDRVLRRIDDFYDEHGRGPDGLMLPYVTHCYKAVVSPHAEVRPPDRGGGSDGTETDSLLIDFS